MDDTYPAPEAVELGSMPPVPGPAPKEAPRIAILAGAALGLIALLALTRSITARSVGAPEEEPEDQE
jgi:hypothetical protein